MIGGFKKLFEYSLSINQIRIILYKTKQTKSKTRWVRLLGKQKERKSFKKVYQK